MAAPPLSRFLSHLYSTTTAFSTLLLQLLILLKSIFKNLRHSGNLTLIATDRYLELVEETNPTIRYQIGVPDIGNCVVCLSEFEEGENVRKLQCKHVFHKDCLDRWLLQPYVAACPLCRIKVLPEMVTEEYFPTRNLFEFDDDSEELLLFFSVLVGPSSH